MQKNAALISATPFYSSHFQWNLIMMPLNDRHSCKKGRKWRLKAYTALMDAIHV